MKNKLDNLNIRLKDGKAFKQWQRLKAANKAVELKIDNLAKLAGVPTSKTFKRNCKGFLTDGNGNPLAKFSVYDMPPRSMPACKVCRVS
jgi:hypothetical protein